MLTGGFAGVRWARVRRGWAERLGSDAGRAFLLLRWEDRRWRRAALSHSRPPKVREIDSEMESCVLLSQLKEKPSLAAGP